MHGSAQSCPPCTNFGLAGTDYAKYAVPGILQYLYFQPLAAGIEVLTGVLDGCIKIFSQKLLESVLGRCLHARYPELGVLWAGCCRRCRLGGSRL